MFSPGDARVGRGRRADAARAGLNKIQRRPGLTRCPAPSCHDPRGPISSPPSPELVSSRPGQTLTGDKNYFGRDFEAQLADMHIKLLRPARKGEAERAGSQLSKPLRQVIESINETFKGQLDLERHHGRTPGGVIVRVLQRLLALTAAIRHNQHTGQPITRSLTPYDH
jgi:hypothetical protein